MKNPFIIGAGGVASYLLPCLIKAFKPDTITIIDKDVLEERNLDRQLFNEHLIGSNKAVALSAMFPPSESICVIEDWFTTETPIPDHIDTIICVADNHEARRNAIRAAYDRGLRCYLGGNEYFDAEAIVTWEAHTGTKLDPRVRYPAIANSFEGSPFRCQGEAQKAHPQLAIANYRCAGHLMHLMYAWERYLPSVEAKDRAKVAPLLPIEISSSVTGTEILNTVTLSK
jgi:molybdopterin/thiamine biosynthesis adenylyltransferase